MTTVDKQKLQLQELQNKLWEAANVFRGNMDPADFKNYALGLIFYRFLSEKVEETANKILEEDGVEYKQAFADEELREDLKSELIDSIGYIIEPKYLFKSLIQKTRAFNQAEKFSIEDLQSAINSLMESVVGQKSEEAFRNLFDDMELSSSKLGKTVKERTDLMSRAMHTINQISFKYADTDIDVLGDAYEYLIGEFAANAGKRAGEFYTPQQVSKLLAEIVTLNKEDIKSAYDPCCGSGSLLLRLRNYSNVRNLVGQELNSTTYNLARMNMILHGVSYERFDIKNGDTLESPQHSDKKFEAIVANPPYSLDWSASNKFLDDDRFSGVGVLAPSSKADLAFVQHMLYHLDEKGTMAVVLPHGVLFRGGTESTIRKFIVKEQNYLDTIIGLPGNLFFGTPIATCILIFKKNRENKDNILFIDASKEYEAGKKQNYLRDSDLDNILAIYEDRLEIEGHSHVATMEEIEKNDYNLSINNYVGSGEVEEELDLEELAEEIVSIDSEISKLDKELEEYFKDLGIEYKL